MPRRIDQTSFIFVTLNSLLGINFFLYKHGGYKESSQQVFGIPYWPYYRDHFYYMHAERVERGKTQPPEGLGQGRASASQELINVQQYPKSVHSQA